MSRNSCAKQIDALRGSLRDARAEASHLRERACKAEEAEERLERERKEAAAALAEATVLHDSDVAVRASSVGDEREGKERREREGGGGAEGGRDAESHLSCSSGFDKLRPRVGTDRVFFPLADVVVVTHDTTRN